MKTQAEKMTFLLSNLKQYVDVIKEHYNELVDDQASGFEEGIYDVETTPEIKTLEKLLGEIEGIEIPEHFKPDVYIYVEGGLIQGASANCRVTLDIFDKDNYDGCDEEEEEEFIENFGTPEEWDKSINEMTEKGEIMPIY